MAGERERLLALAERCETASGPDRDLEIAIWRLVERPDAAESKVPLPWLANYTASLDAALTLVPEECGWMVMGCAAKVGRQPSRGATPALALASAALRARAETQP